jgi:hypothetical protein
MGQATASQRARRRATESRLRAYYHAPKREGNHGYYVVHNLRTGAKYIVWYNVHRNFPAWECECATNNLKQRCKHVQRVMDREERRVKQEALADG